MSALGNCTGVYLNKHDQKSVKNLYKCLGFFFIVRILIDDYLWGWVAGVNSTDEREETVGVGVDTDDDVGA